MNTTEYRNLAEQVLKNKEDILKHFQRDEILADFGIRIIGSVLTKEELDAIPTTGLKYGDAYAVGTQSPFTYYIWTRANNLSPVDYWFDFGTIAIAGPRGPQGPRGADGADGQASRWHFYGIPFDFPRFLEYKPGDLIIDSLGTIYYCINGEEGWYEYVINTVGQTGAEGPRGYTGPQGPVGPVGPKGDTGDVGGFINIAGIVADEYSLPDPELIGNLTVAYLVGTATPYDLYIQVGSTSDTAQWFNAGPLNVATMVTVGGQYQNTWDADTKLDKLPSGTTSRIYATNETGFYNASGSGYVGYVALWTNNADGQPVLNSKGAPTSNTHLANKQYVDTKYTELLARIEALENAGKITFRINGREFQANEGMSWFSWVYSDYNTADCTIDMGSVYYYGTQQISLWGTPVQEGDIIYENTDYDASY